MNATYSDPLMQALALQAADVPPGMEGVSRSVTDPYRLARLERLGIAATPAPGLLPQLASAAEDEAASRSYMQMYEDFTAGLPPSMRNGGMARLFPAMQYFQEKDDPMALVYALMEPMVPGLLSRLE